MEKILGIITARGGSKRIPRKNIKPFLGKPLLAWTIEVAKESKVLDRLVLTTDDKNIAETGRKYGAEVPFLRPAKLAQDTTGSLPVLQHTIKWLKDNENYEAPWLILLEPSSPGRRPFHIKEVVNLIKERGAKIDSIIGISEIPANLTPSKALKIQKDGAIVRYDGTAIGNLVHRTQDISKFYFINSAIYVFKTKNLFKKKPSLWGNKVLGYIMDSKYALDIDIPEDWILAEIKMRKILEESSRESI